MTEQEKLKNRLRGLTQYKSFSEQDLDNLVNQKLQEKEILKNSRYINEEEKEFAEELLDKYLSQNTISSEADKGTLSHLIYQELIAKRLEKELNREYAKANPTVPLQMVEKLDEVIERIGELKENLGLTSQEKNQQSWIETWNKLKLKTLKYMEEHKGCNIVRCPHCQNMFYLLMRTEHLTPEKCNWFRGTLLYNKELLELVENKIITEEKAAEILGVSKFYINYLYENIYLKEKANVIREN